MKNTLRITLAGALLAGAGVVSAAVDTSNSPYEQTFETASGVAFSNTFWITPTQTNMLRVTVWGPELQYSSLAFSIVGGPTATASALGGSWIATFNDAKNNTYANQFSLLAGQAYQLTLTGVTKVLDEGVSGVVNLSGRYGTVSLPAVTALAIATPVPEPETYAMLLAGLGLVGAIARRRRTKGT